MLGIKLPQLLGRIFGGERTGKQVPPVPGGSGLAILQGGAEGTTNPKPDSHRYNTYRDMRSDPTIALARMIARAPIQSADWSVSGEDEDIKTFIEDEFTRLWPALIDDMLYAFDYGFAAFEKVFEIEGAGKVHYKKIKALLPEKTTILVESETGSFSGLKQQNITLETPYSFLYTYDGEAGNLYGRSRHENIRTTAWQAWKDTQERFSKYGKKVAGATPLIEYPEGMGLDANGQEVSNFELAKAILRNLDAINGVAMPNTLSRYMEDLARLGGAGKEALKAWNISFLETKGAHGAEFIAGLDYYDKLKLRGWLTPERAALEGQHGTKAESESHSQWSYLIGNMLTQEIFRHVNWYLVEPLIALNFGEDRSKEVTIEYAGIDPGLIAFLRDLMLRLYGAPANADLAIEALDMPQVIDLVGVPRNETPVESVIVRAKPLRPGEGEEENISSETVNASEIRKQQ